MSLVNRWIRWIRRNVGKRFGQMDEMDKKVKVSDIAHGAGTMQDVSCELIDSKVEDTDDTIGRYSGIEEVFEENTKKPVEEECTTFEYCQESCSDNEDINKSVAEVNDENIKVDTNDIFTSATDGKNDVTKSRLVLQNNKNFAVEDENIEVDTDSNDIFTSEIDGKNDAKSRLVLQNNKNLSGTVSGFSYQFDGKPCKLQTTSRKNVIYHVENSKIFKIYGNTFENILSDYSRLKISEVSKSEMIMLWVITNNPSEIIRSIIEAISTLDSPFPKLVHIEIQPDPDEREDKQPHGKTIHFSSKDTCPNLNDYAHMVITYTDEPYKSEDFFQNIRTGGDTLTNFIKKSRVNKCIDTLLEKVWLSRNFEADDLPWHLYIENEMGSYLKQTRSYMEQKRVNKPLMVYVENDKFDHTWNKDRPGTQEEKRKLKELCDTTGGVFSVIKNQKKTSLLKKMEAVIMERNRDTDVLMPFISSHGYEGGFYTRDGMKYHINELMAIFNKVDISIPILCCLMVCQTSNNDLLVLNQWPIIKFNQHYRDNVVIVAPYPGTTNVRSVLDGSWLVDGFCTCFPGGNFYKEKLIHKYPEGMSWNNIMEEVICMLHDRKETDSKGVMYEMLPCVILDTCRYDVFFPLNTCFMEATS